MNSDSPLSDTIYYSPNNSDNESDSPLIIKKIDCYCLNKKDSCLIFCFNAETNQFESMDCKKFKN